MSGKCALLNKVSTVSTFCCPIKWLLSRDQDQDTRVLLAHCLEHPATKMARDKHLSLAITQSIVAWDSPPKGPRCSVRLLCRVSFP